MLQSVCCDLFRGFLIKFGAFAFIPIEAHFFGGNYEHHNFCVCGKRRSRKNISFRSVHSNSVGGLPGKRILAVDADPAVGLSTALNMEPTLTLDDIRLKIAESIENGDTSDAIELLSEARLHLQDCITESGNISFLAIGRPEAAGCYCKVNAYLKQVIETISENFDYVVIDGEAGIEQINRRVMENITYLILVSDSSRKGIQVISTIHDVSKRLTSCKKTGIIFNRVRAGFAPPAISEATPVLGGVAVALIYCKVKRISFWSLADTLMPSLVLGQAIGRWGNFVNQEAYVNQITNPSLCFFPYGVYIEEIGQWRQATVFYESALNLALLTAMLICYPHFRRKGYLLPFYMIGYGTIRLFVEGLRSDSLYLLPGIRVSQVLSGCLIILGIIILFIIHKRQEVRQ